MTCIPDDHPDTPIISVEHLIKRYPGRRGQPAITAVDDISFELMASSSLAIVGESGSGKSTVAKMIVGLESVDAGSIKIFGKNYTKPPKTRRDRRSRGKVIQLVFQDPAVSLDPLQTVASCLTEAVRVHISASRTAIRQRVDELAQMVGLNPDLLDSLPSALSGGQQQRVAIARALAAEPEILVLDEAVAALDVSVQAQILNLLISLREDTGITYIFISHDLAVVRYVTDRMIVMKQGRIVEAGITRDVLHHPAHPYTQRLIASIPRLDWDLNNLTLPQREDSHSSLSVIDQHTSL